ncbi:MAG: cytochrome c [Gammaproteobacteria bacterium]|nr:MAG: cytochrome c [Gammaproteobacteria bacterium]
MLFKTSFPEIIVLGITLLAPQNAMAETAITEVNPARQNELMYFVKHDCGSCHGMTLKGGLGPALLPETLSAQPKEYLVTTILEGRKNTAMPPWKSMLSRNDALWITEQLQSGRIDQTQIAKGAR